MYQFSRSIYRELAHDVVPAGDEDIAETRQRFLQGVRERPWSAWPLDRHYFAQAGAHAVQRRARFFPIAEQLRVYRVMRAARDARHGVRGQPARDGRDVRRQPAVLPREHAQGAPRASGCRCRAASTARRTSTSTRSTTWWPRPEAAAAGTESVRGHPAVRSAAAVACRGVILGVDVGGTFTDAALLAGDRLVTAKAPTTPADQSEGVMAAVGEALASGRRVGRRRGALRARHDRGHERAAGGHARRARALLATEGFTDLEELGRQARPELYRLCAGHPPPLVPARAARGRARAHRAGRRASTRWTRMGCCRALSAGCDDVEAVGGVPAVGLSPPGPRAAGGRRWWRRPARDVHVSTSHETAGVFREYERCATTVVDAAAVAAAAPLPASG